MLFMSFGILSFQYKPNTEIKGKKQKKPKCISNKGIGLLQSTIPAFDYKGEYALYERYIYIDSRFIFI